MNDTGRKPAASTARRLLGIRPGATEPELHRAFRRAARELHPDAGGSSGDVGALRAARDVLLHAPCRDEHARGRDRVFVRRRSRLARAADLLLQRHRHARRGASGKMW